MIGAKVLKKMNINVPEGSIYFWMYTCGLKQIPIQKIEQAVSQAGKQIRKKDYQNYWNGYYNHQMYHGKRVMSMLDAPIEQTIDDFYKMKYSDYPIHPYLNQPEIENRFVPCSKEGKPIIKWSQGCMTSEDAMSLIHCETLAENTKGTKFIIIDIDGDHGDVLHKNVYEMFHDWVPLTHCLNKPGFKVPVSYHLTFYVDRIIPTIHRPKAHIDIVGNKMNSLRYFKNKIWNKIDPIPMTDELWTELQRRIKILEDNNGM